MDLFQAHPEVLEDQHFKILACIHLAESVHHLSNKKIRLPLMPLVTVLVPCRDGSRYIRQMIESVACQTFGDFELLVVDDGSTDDSAEIVQSYAEIDKRIKLAKSPGQGIVAALNYGISISDSELIARIDSDDEMHPQRLEVQVGEFQKDRRLSFCGSSISVTDSVGCRVGAIRFPATNSAIVSGLREGRWVIAHPAITYKRFAIERLGGYSEPAKHAEDLDLWLRAAQARYSIINLKKPLTSYRVHGKNDTIQNSDLHLKRRSFALLNDYAARDSSGNSEKGREFATPFSIIADGPKETTVEHLDYLISRLKCQDLRSFLSSGFILHRFIFGLIFLALSTGRPMLLAKALQLLFNGKINIFPYLWYYAIRIFPVNFSNTRTARGVRARGCQT